MTIDEIVQKIYEEHYQDAMCMRDGMIREIVQRTLELALEDLYSACAQAFGTTRDDAKRRLISTFYGERHQDKKP